MTYLEARKEYVKLLKFCTPKKADEQPDNLLQLLNDAHEKLVKAWEEEKTKQ